MSNAFEDRKKGFEAKYQHDEEQRFRLVSHRNHLFGLWAAEALGLTGIEAETYARGVVEAELTARGEDAVIGRVLGDLAAQGIDIGEGRLRIKLEKCQGQAEARERAHPHQPF
ncbi:aldolase [Rhodospirillum rubrum]|uniref:DUF1476 domain-containing protein n=1 Tax=Rhodospirillum rubrum TaxID=1085 RepID=UPI001903E960|nr:DUF1476 domain-containing protein [Rhodospirillum rubrum]MBK1664023.1 aldolase [Rhodospirillum rubrum]MBK1675419.1 aldolase [Rhodospirillum rubrum]